MNYSDKYDHSISQLLLFFLLDDAPQCRVEYSVSFLEPGESGEIKCKQGYHLKDKAASETKQYLRCLIEGKFEVEPIECGMLVFKSCISYYIYANCYILKVSV